MIQKSGAGNVAQHPETELEKLELETVVPLERQALALGGMHAVELRKSAQRWLVEKANGLLVFEEGVTEVVDRLAAGGVN